MGSEHAVMDEDSARVRLEQEVAELITKGILAPEVEELSPDGTIVRVHRVHSRYNETIQYVVQGDTHASSSVCDPQANRGDKSSGDTGKG